MRLRASPPTLRARLAPMAIRPWTRSDAANIWFAGALAGALVITIADALAGSSWVAIPLLTVPPLVAAVGSGSRRTAATALICAALSLVLGWPDEVFAERAHLV